MDTKQDRDEVRPKMVTLSLNDYVIGVYTSDEKAMAAAERDWKQRSRVQHSPVLLEFGEEWDSLIGPYKKYYYHTREFEVDAEAAL